MYFKKFCHSNCLKVINFVIFSCSVYICQLELLVSTKCPMTPKQTQYYSCTALSGGRQPMVYIRSLAPTSELEGLQGKLRVTALVHLPIFHMKKSDLK